MTVHGVHGLTLDRILLLAAALLVVASLTYGFVMLVGSRHVPRRDKRRGPASGLQFVFLIPCMNEERVISNSVNRLLTIPGDSYFIMPIDDASTDSTAEIVESLDDPRVWLYRRALPQAQQGKGEALNAAIRHLLDGRLRDCDPDNTIIVIVDADGRLEPHALVEVAPYFADPTVGGVQIGVRINNRATSRLARMQDMEFVIYTEVFQRGRRHLGSVGLGGNGQFMRLSALQSLGDSPWSKSLTEDLDLGVRLLALGWRNEFCHTAAVHQQGVAEIKRLVRQRSRWFQGHLTSIKMVPMVLRRILPVRAAIDLMYHLTGPVLLLISSCLTLSFVVSLGGATAEAIGGENPIGWWILITYALSFGPATVYSTVYWTKERTRGVSLPRCLAWGHLYALYGLMWYAAGWWALGRVIKGSNSWAKTERLAEAAEIVGAS